MACRAAGRFQQRAKGLEQAWIRVLREAGASNVKSQPRLNRLGLFGIRHDDFRRLDAAAYGLPGRDLPLLIDATLRSPLSKNGQPRPGAATIPGSTFAAAYSEKAAEYPDVANSGQCTFRVLAAEVFGRFDEPSRTLITELSHAHVQGERRIMRRRLQLIYHRRWWGILSVAVQKAMAESLVSSSFQGEADGERGQRQ